MTPLRVILARVRALFQRRRLETALDEEIRAHLDRAEEEHRARGLSPQAAREAARRDFGGIEPMKERYRDRRRFNWLDSLARDARFGLRMVARQPGLLVVVVLTMALGIGINTAVFGLMRALILSPLPVREPDRIVFVTATDFQVHSIPNYVDLRDRNTTFSQLVAYRPSPMAMAASDWPFGMARMPARTISAMTAPL